MCGLVGFIGFDSVCDNAGLLLANMLGRIRHRGPDDDGQWVEGRVALGHCRLSIQDLSPAGHQPMLSENGRHVLVFNGEIYNHLALRKCLESEGGHRWRGLSDTETLLAAISAWGVDTAIGATVGMFAIAIWDRVSKTLTLVRDRIGEKPLYYGWQNGVFIFGSELKALCAHPDFEGRIDWDAVGSFLHRNYFPAPQSIYKGIKKLPPGAIVTLTEADISARVSPVPRFYWSLWQAVVHANEAPFRGTFFDAVDELDNLLLQSVAHQCSADVPIGAFLSGGIDSSLIVALMQKASSRNVNTFSIGLEDRNFDETHHAKAVADYLGTQHIQQTITVRDAIELIPSLPRIWDEPLGDSSQIPTYFLSALAKRSVGVALSGDGGDELFLGYAQYPLLRLLWMTRSLVHFPWDPFLSTADAVGLSRPLVRKARTIVMGWRQQSPGDLSQYWMDCYRSIPFPMTPEASAAKEIFPLLSGAASNIGVYDAATYLPEDIMTKVDRASMAVSLETRAPLLDHRIVEFSMALPEAFKLQSGSGKVILKELLNRYVPRQIVERPKQGFSVPMSQWLRGELRPWAESALDFLDTHSHVLDKKVIREMWRLHISGEADRSAQLWGLLSLSMFLSESVNK
jgi:asparagine synthase (glutamine-hydrolysing)